MSEPNSLSWRGGKVEGTTASYQPQQQRANATILQLLHLISHSFDYTPAAIFSNWFVLTTLFSQSSTDDNHVLGWVPKQQHLSVARIFMIMACI